MKSIIRTAALAMLALVVLTFTGLQAHAQTAKMATLKVTWDYENPPPDLAGFRLYQSDTSGQYTIGQGHEVAAAPADARTLKLMNVPEGMHYWVLTAFDSEGNESPPSEEASKRVDKTPPHSPSDVEVEVEVLVNVTMRGKQGQ